MRMILTLFTVLLLLMCGAFIGALAVAGCALSKSREAERLERERRRRGCQADENGVQDAIESLVIQDN